jgi:very-short-patch-repair endonuclease
LKKEGYNCYIKYISPSEARTKIGNLKYLEELRLLSRNNRKNPTDAEDTFWKLVSYKRTGFKFVRQKPIGRCILDFYCSKLLLGIEIDGDSHDHKEYYDKARDNYLNNRGIKTVRYRNEDVLYNLLVVKRDLIKQIESRLKELK